MGDDVELFLHGAGARGDAFKTANLERAFLSIKNITYKYSIYIYRDRSTVQIQLQ